MSEVVRIVNESELSVTLTTTLSDDSTSNGEFKVGEGVNKLVYLDKGTDGVISGTVTGIQYTVNGVDVAVTAIVVKENATGKEVELPINIIKLCGEPEVKVEVGQTVADVLASIEDGQVVVVPATPEDATVTPVEVIKSVTVKGAMADTSAVSSERMNTSVEGETVVGAITVKEKADVELIGVAGTGLVDIAESGENVLFRNTKIVNVVPTATKSYLVTGKNTDPVKLVAKDCYFGTAAVNEENPKYAVFNLFEMNRPFADGTTFENCYFDKDCCTHNMINLYEVEDGATITIKNCTFYTNAIRVGIKGDKHCTINIENCTFLEATIDLYSGFMLIQPYGKQTTNMSNIKININNLTNKSKDDRLWLLYAGKSDMQFDDYNVPTITVDGKVMVAPKKK